MADLNVNSIADEAGTGAPDFAAMPSVAGDLVVESGSNTDGEWTRWADGTQICGIDSIDLTTTTSAHILDAVWSYPAAFSIAPVPKVSPVSVGADGSRDSGAYTTDDISTSAGALRRISNSGSNLTASAPQEVSAFVAGRWK